MAKTFYLIMKMMNRLEDREEVFQDRKKAKQYWKSTQMKRVEEIVKPENRFIYREAKDFLPWIVDHKKIDGSTSRRVRGRHDYVLHSKND